MKALRPLLAIFCIAALLVLAQHWIADRPPSARVASDGATTAPPAPSEERATAGGERSRTRRSASNPPANNPRREAGNARAAEPRRRSPGPASHESVGAAAANRRSGAATGESRRANAPPAPRVDPDLRRRLEDAGIEPDAIDRMEARLRRASYDEAPLGDAGPESPTDDSANADLARDAAEDATDALEDESPPTPETGPRRVTLARVRPDMPAGLAGLTDGDQLLTYDGRAIPDIPSLRSAIYEAPPTALVPVTILRGGERYEVWLEPGVLGARLYLAPSPP